MDIIAILSAVGVGIACALIVRDWITGLFAVVFPLLLFRDRWVVAAAAEATLIITLALGMGISLIYALFVSPHSKIPHDETLLWSIQYNDDEEYMERLESMEQTDVFMLAAQAESAEELRENIVNAE